MKYKQMGPLYKGLEKQKTNPTDLEIGWAAGFLEGEGTFASRRRGQRTHLRIRANQVNPEPLRRLQHLFGGSVSWYAKGGVNGIWMWEVSHRKARTLAHLIRPLLSSRRLSQLRRCESS